MLSGPPLKVGLLRRTKRAGDVCMIVPEFQKFTAEGVIIGRLLAGYGPLESALSSSVVMVRNDPNSKRRVALLSWAGNLTGTNIG